jgi:hypothetical protein
MWFSVKAQRKRYTLTFILYGVNDEFIYNFGQKKNMKGIDYFEDLKADRRIILKRMLEK